MIGNPFARPLAASAVSVPGGIQGDLFQAFDPVRNSYAPVSRLSGLGIPTSLAAWQGVFAETLEAAAPTFTFDASVAAPPASRSEAEPVVALVLQGRTGAGAETHDGASRVRFSLAADVGWDALDASKLTPPGGAYALVAAVLERDGVPYRVAVDALPALAAAGSPADVSVLLSVATPEAGTYTLTADASALPDGWTAELRDLVSGLVAAAVDGITFAAGPSEWQDRFELVLRARGATASAAGPAARELSVRLAGPNPVRARAAILLDSPGGEARVEMFDALGRRVAVLVDGAVAPGELRLALDVSHSRRGSTSCAAPQGPRRRRSGLSSRDDQQRARGPEPARGPSRRGGPAAPALAAQQPALRRHDDRPALHVHPAHERDLAAAVGVNSMATGSFSGSAVLATS